VSRRKRQALAFPVGGATGVPYTRRSADGILCRDAEAPFVLHFSAREITMPLRDHFRPPVEKSHSWEELHGMWPAVIVQKLFTILPEGFVAAPG